MTTAEGIHVAFKGRLGQFDYDVAFAAPGRGITVLFGPSGCGKTTTLRCIAGLQRLDGTCTVLGETWQDGTTFLPAHRRPIGYVFQEASLFPHMAIRRNLLYGLRGRTPQSGQGMVGFDAVVDLLGLATLLDRAPARLSGGERQRVAIGRAILSQPRLLLMDEPLSALDRDRREEIMPFLERLHETLDLPILLVTHDMATLERLADHVILVSGGRVRASGPLAAVQSDPALPLALGRDAAVNLEATVVSTDGDHGLAEITVPGARLLMPAPADAVPGKRLRIRIAAGDVSLALTRNDSSTILNILPARILETAEAGPHEIAVVLGLGEDGSGARVLARVTQLSWSRLGLAEGMTVQAQVKSVALARRG